MNLGGTVRHPRCARLLHGRVRHARALTLLCVLLCGLLSATAVSAQSVPPFTATPAAALSVDEGLRRQEERTRFQQQELQPQADVLKREPRHAVAAELSAETPCFVIRDIEISGDDAERFEWLSETAAGFVGRCAGVEGLRRIVSALDARLIDSGYVTTRASLPEQNLQTGRLRIQLHVGRVAEVTMVEAGAGEATPDTRWGTWRNAFPLSAGDLLDVRDLEQGVEQMNRLPSQSVTTLLEPGREPDTSLVVIERRAGDWPSRIRGGASLDNAGSATLGRTQLSGYLALDNPLGLNDILNLSGNTNAEHPSTRHRSQGASANYSVPWGYDTFSLNESYSRFAQVVQGTTVQFLSAGNSETTEARWHRTVWRTASLKAGIYGGVSTRRAESFLDDVEIIVQRRRTAQAEAGVTYRQLVGSGSVDIDLGYRKGIGSFGAQDDLVSAATGGVTLRPRIWGLTANGTQSFTLGGQPIQYTALVRAQLTHDATLSIDQIALGNRYSVRGFDENTVLLAESGYFVRNELATPVKLIDSAQTAVYLAVDAGRVWGPSAALLAGTKLAGLVIGLRGKFGPVQTDFGVGTPLYKPAGFHSGRVNPYLTATYAF